MTRKHVALAIAADGAVRTVLAVTARRDKQDGRRRAPRGRLVPVVLLTALATACASAPEPLDLPPLGITVHRSQHNADPDAPTTSTQTSRRLQLQITAVRQAPVGSDVASAASVLVAAAGQPFRGASGLPGGTLWLDGQATAVWEGTQRNASIGDRCTRGTSAAAVVGGRTTQFAVDLPGAPGIDVDLAESGLRVTLRQGPAGAAPYVRIAAVIASDGEVALFLPVLPDSGARQVLAGHVLTLRDVGPTTASEVAAAMEPVHAEPAPTMRTTDAWSLALAAVGAVNRRPALLAIARSYPCSRGIDVLLAADEPALVAITDGLRTLAPRATPPVWPFEATLWRALLPRASRDELAPGLYACFVRHLGGVALDTSVLQELLADCTDAEQFAARLRAANLDLLDDRIAAVRVRAFDWLRGSGVEVPDYTPFAPAKERREALRRFHRAAAATTEAR